jgi:hypothetical protein
MAKQAEIDYNNGYNEALNEVLEMIDSIIFNIDTSLMHGKQATAIISQLQQLQQEIRDKKRSLQFYYLPTYVLNNY